MSERRCGAILSNGNRCVLSNYDHGERHCAVGSNGWLWEPQEGAPISTEAAGNRLPSPDEPCGGVPSCDSQPASSEQIEELRAKLDYILPKYNAQATSHNEKQMAIQAKLAELEKERDGLRAKLAKTETTLSEYATALGATEAKLSEAARIHAESEVKHAYRVKELEAKLASVTNQLCAEARAHGKTQAKLAVAETRERELGELYAEAEAKLAKTEKRLAGFEAWGPSKQHELVDRIEELEAKLAEAEKKRDAYFSLWQKAENDKEAAEARVRELDLSIKLIAAGNGNIRTENNR